MGAIFGSFMNAVIYRVPRLISLYSPTRSFCIHCKNTIKWYHNIPILSYLFLRGKCNYCNDKIDIRYFFIEVFNASMWGLLYLKMGDLSISLIITAIVLSLSLILVFIDIEYREIPDSVSLLALVLSFFILLPDIQQTIEVIKNGLIFMGAFTLLRFLVSFIMDREAMGEGDIIVAGIIGSLLGGIGGLKAIFFAALFALPINAYSKYKLGTEEVAFVPFLFIGLFVQYFVEF